ncbi:TadE/TadG family type IV pilus assembly protein [Boseongicola aestuarii]|uniref:Uncharacterized protein n=1 Tax=Boseongicola aestuarii TaxID=1470561 RepID=A0A238J428_9RHOB|nr:TadE/TadG family type IV pilus assembly protein [Boseongicola aestuarii]SMX24720.1 hypothetical protein BOA8489_02847 [Boseongicola aestuarii]
MQIGVNRARTFFRGHCRDEEGAMSVLNLYFLMTLAIFGGIAIDMASLISARNQLQTASDVAAHAAMVSLKNGSTVAEAKEKALEYAQANMPTGRYGDVLREENVHFGVYWQASKKFIIQDNLDEAVMVTSDRLAENANPVSSFLLRLVGFNEFDVRSQAVFINGDVPCVGAGFYAEGRVDLQANNTFTEGFCVHSNSHVEINNGNTFELEPAVGVDGKHYPVIVSVAEIMEHDLTADDLIIPANGYEQNEGLWEAQRGVGEYHFDVDAFITEVVAGVLSPTKNPHTRDYITDKNVYTVDVLSGSSGGGNGNNSDPNTPTNCKVFSVDCLRPNAINEVNCTGTGLSIPAEVFENVVLITDCDLDFANGSEMRNATFITRSTDDNSITSPQGLDLGNMEVCGESGGAALITYGGMKSAATMQLLGGQIIAAGDVNFAAQADGFVGASVIAGGEINGTSNSSFEGCPGVVLHNFFPTTSPPPRLAG